MGHHRNFSSSPAGGGEPAPFDPKVGRQKDTCRGVAEIELVKEWLKKDEEYWREKYGRPPEDYFGPGATIQFRYWDDFHGDPWHPNLGYPATAVPRYPPHGLTIYNANEPIPAGATTNGLGEPSPQREAPGTSGPDMSGGPRTRVMQDEPDEYVVEKTETSTKTVVKEDKIKAKNEKGKIIKEKTDKSSDTPKSAADFVSDIVSPLGFNNVIIDPGISLVLQEGWNFKEMFIDDALDTLAKLTGASWTVDGKGNFHFFLPETRAHSVIATTDPAAFGDETPVNPIKKGSLDYAQDATQTVNKVQVGGSKLKSEPRDEVLTIPQGAPVPEFHTSYPPDQVTAIAMEDYTEGPPIVTPIQEIRLDWGDRPWIREEYPATSPFWPDHCYYPSPLLNTPPSPPVSSLVAYVNPKEKIIRIFDKDTGLPIYGTYAAAYSVLRVTMNHYDPCYMIVEDQDSIAENGVCEELMVIPSGCVTLTQDQARMLAEAHLRDYKDPLESISFEVFNDVYKVGDYVRVVDTRSGLDQSFCVNEVERSFDAHLRGTQQDPGHSVKIKAGAKMPIGMGQILGAMQRQIQSLQRTFMNINQFSPTGFDVPVERQVRKEDKWGVIDSVFVEYHIPGRADDARIDSGRMG